MREQRISVIVLTLTVLLIFVHYVCYVSAQRNVDELISHFKEQKQQGAHFPNHHPNFYHGYPINHHNHNQGNSINHPHHNQGFGSHYPHHNPGSYVHHQHYNPGSNVHHHIHHPLENSVHHPHHNQGNSVHHPHHNQGNSVHHPHHNQGFGTNYPHYNHQSTGSGSATSAAVTQFPNQVHYPRSYQYPVPRTPRYFVNFYPFQKGFYY